MPTAATADPRLQVRAEAQAPTVVGRRAADSRGYCAEGRASELLREVGREAENQDRSPLESLSKNAHPGNSLPRPAKHAQATRPQQTFSLNRGQ